MDPDVPHDRVLKKQKTGNGPRHVPGTSRVFAPYRTVGLVSPTEVPFTSVPLGKTTFQITTCIGRSLHTYDLRSGLNLVFITSPQTPEPITASTAWKDKVLAAWGGSEADAARGVWVFQRGKKCAELHLPRHHSENVVALCIIGSWIVGLCHSHLVVWKSATLELYTSLRGTSPVPFTRCVTSLPTFLNKIIVGRQDGSAEIWNVSSGKLVFTILPPSTSYGAVTAIEPTPALSLVAIAFESGPLLIHDVQTDQTVIRLNSQAGAPTTSISFRADGMGAGDDGKKPGVMATASAATGDVTLWDLNNGGRKAGVLRGAHAQPTTDIPGGTSRVQFLPGQAILVSSGLDNSLKTWIFDETPFSSVPRILHQRRGHAAHISRLVFLPVSSDGSDDTGKWLMAGSKDRSLWAWSLRRDGQSTEISQGSVQSKAKKQGLLAGDRQLSDLRCPPITDIACCLNRDGGIGALPGKQPIWQHGSKGKLISAEVSASTGWESVLTAHENDRTARTWFWGRKRAGRWAFNTGDEGNVTTVAMSSCGTFGLVGSDKGGIDMFNMQSGIHRQRFPARLTPIQAKQLKLDVAEHGLVEEDDGKKKFYRGQGRHTSAVIGVAVDSLNRTVVSAGADGRVKLWDFSTGLLEDEIDWSASAQPSAMHFHSSTDLASFACADGCIRVLDISTRKLVRELWVSRTRVPELPEISFADHTCSADGRWIAACAGEMIFLWDLPTGHLIDAFKLPATCTSLAFSPTGEFLATATTEGVGVDVWTNRTLFTHVPARHINDYELTQIVRSSAAQAPTSCAQGSQDTRTEWSTAEDDENMHEDEQLPLLEDGADAIAPLSADLLTLSLVPRPRWQNLLYLDLIRKRNKPIEPPKKPEKAPFFLPSIQGQSGFGQNSAAPSEASGQHDQSRYLAALAQSQSQFTTLLHGAADSGDFGTFIAHFKTLSPAAADIEIRSLHSGGSERPSEHVTFLRALTFLLCSKRDFEIVQAWMAVYLRTHGDVVLADDSVRQAVSEWRYALDAEKRRMDKLAGYVGGMVGYLRAARV